MSERSEKFFDNIIDIFKKGLKERGVKDIPLVTATEEWKGISIDMPRKVKDAYHGSSYEILCNRTKSWCKIKGDLVTDPGSEFGISKSLDESDCKIFSTHRHLKRKDGRPPREESHLHFICQDKDDDDTMRIIKLLKDY